MVWTAAWTDFVICLLFGWLWGSINSEKRKIGMGIRLPMYIRIVLYRMVC